MSIKTIFSAVVVEDEPISTSSINYAVSMAAMTHAQLSIIIGVPRISARSGIVITDVPVLVDAANVERRTNAETYSATIKELGQDVDLTIEIIQENYLDIRNRMVATSRMSDIVVLGPSGNFTTSHYDIMRTMLFTSGRPVLLVPMEWSQPAFFNRLLVAWDGGLHAARALADSIPLLESADHTYVLFVERGEDKMVIAAPLEAHIRRHCLSLTTKRLQMNNGDVGKTIRDYAISTYADLIVMGAWGNSQLSEFTLGAATQDAIANLQRPTLLSH
jgi:nucleotide-binding universal stress UspA family protein